MMSLSSVLSPILTLPVTSLIITIATLGCYCVWRRNKSRGMPPGPPSWPLIGSLLSLRSNDVREELCRLARQYGDMFTMDMGMDRTIMLASCDAITEALIKNSHALSGRPQEMFVFKEFTEGKGVIGTQGPLWQEHRKFIHGVFREFGIGRPVFEEKIQEETSFLIQTLTDNTDRPYDPAPIIHKSVANVINNVIFGQRYDYQDPLFLSHMDILERGMRILGNSGPLTLFPFLKYLPGDLFLYKQVKGESASVHADYQDRIDEHRQSRTPGVVRDLIDAYLEESERQKDKLDSTFTDTQLIFTIGDLFGAGTDTTAVTLRWALLYLLHNPEVLQRVQREIGDVIGSSRMPSMKDKQNLPYTEAVLCEVQRMAVVVPLGVPHACTEDVTLRGYRIPKGTHFMTVLYAAHRDPKVWEDPYRFNPERFLNDEGNFDRGGYLIPFSVGRRVCLGESLARMELFLIFVALMQHLRFSVPAGVPLPPLTGTLGMTYTPPHFEVLMEQKL